MVSRIWLATGYRLQATGLATNNWQLATNN